MGDLTTGKRYDRFLTEFGEDIAAQEETLSQYWGVPAQVKLNDQNDLVQVFLTVTATDGFQASLPLEDCTAFTANPDDEESDEDCVEQVACFFQDSPANVRARLKQAGLID